MARTMANGGYPIEGAPDARSATIEQTLPKAEKRLASWLVFGGAAAIIAAAWLFGGIAEDVINRDAPLGQLDLRVAGWLHQHASPWLTSLMFIASDIGSPLMLSLVAIVTALVLFWQRRRMRYLLVALPSGLLLNVIVKHLVHRQRPIFDDPIEVLTSYSFPSGHAMAATILYGTLAAVAIRHVVDRRWRAAVVVAAALMIVLVALSRMYLGVHYLSDVLAGILEGIVWFGVCLAAVEVLQRRRVRSG